MSEQDPQWERQKAAVDSSLDQQWIEGRQAMHEDRAHRPLTWTTEKPTKPGWYGYRDEHTKDENTNKVRGLIFEVRESIRNDGRLLLFTHLNLYGETEDCHHVDELDGEWFGPLEIPE